MLQRIEQEPWCFQHRSIVVKDPGGEVFKLLASDSGTYRRKSTHAGHIRRARRTTGSLIYGLPQSRNQLAINIPPTPLRCSRSEDPTIIRTFVYEQQLLLSAHQHNTHTNHTFPGGCRRKTSLPTSVGTSRTRVRNAMRAIDCEIDGTRPTARCAKSFRPSLLRMRRNLCSTMANSTRRF